MRRMAGILGGLAVIGLAVFLFDLAEARRDPVVRRTTLPLADWPAGAGPVRAVLLSDVHFGNAVMGPERLARIVAQVDALHPDIVLIAGDFIAGHDAAHASAVAPAVAAGLARLHAPLGVVAVFGNHDHWSGTGRFRRALAAAGVRVVSNDAVRRGPLVIGGVDDQSSDRDDIPATIAAMGRLRGARIVLVHGPDVARKLRAPAIAGLLPELGPQVVLAGHLHCGQVTLPGLGPIKKVIDSREADLCGVSRRGRDRLVVGAGLGTSILPIRIGAPPDLWLITFGPAAPTAARPPSPAP